MSFTNHTNPVAKKEHRCDECRGIIKVGEKYHRHAGIWQGDFNSSKHCTVCDGIFNVIFSRMDMYEREEGIQYGQVIEWIENYDDYPDLLLKYTSNMAARGVVVPDWLMLRLENVNRKTA